jgi:ankyrin repeat protein
VVDLLAHGADPNARGPRGQSALMLAVQGSWADPPTGDSLLRALLSHGADSSLRDSSGRTASMTATDPVVRRVLARVLQNGSVH